MKGKTYRYWEKIYGKNNSNNNNNEKNNQRKKQWTKEKMREKNDWNMIKVNIKIWMSFKKEENLKKQNQIKNNKK